MKATVSRKKPRHARIGELPVVILPLEDYERMEEDLEMLSSKSLPRKIEKARQEARTGQVMTLAELTGTILKTSARLSCHASATASSGCRIPAKR